MTPFSFLYNTFFIPPLVGFGRLAALTQPKVRRGLAGRKGLFDRLWEAVSHWGNEGFRIWIHNSSMGEFEQARPLIAALKRRFPDYRVAVTFFSPSGLEHVRNDHQADLITYLPVDTRSNARRFFEILRPHVGIVIRHDLWPNHLLEARRRKIPLILVNCSIRHERYLKLPGVLEANRFLFGVFDEVLAVSEESRRLFHRYRLGEAQVSVIGDTRYDQVVARAQAAAGIVAPLAPMKGDRPGFVMGSTWPSDESVLFEALLRLRDQGLLPWMVLAPHEPTEEHLERLEEVFKAIGFRYARLAEVEKRGIVAEDLLLVDGVGILASLYALGDLCFVGGGFGPGVHNVLEPAALGKVVLFGPRSKNAFEAGELVHHGVGFMVRDADSLYRVLHRFFCDLTSLHRLGSKAASLVAANVGATERVVDRIAHHLPKA